MIKNEYYVNIITHKILSKWPQRATDDLSLGSVAVYNVLQMAQLLKILKLTAQNVQIVVAVL